MSAVPGNQAPQATLRPCQWQGCSQAFSSDAEIYAHICATHVKSRVNKLENNNICQWANCNKVVIAKRHHLKSHILVHMDFKPHVCPQCAKSFKRSHDKNKHVKMVHTLKPAADPNEPAKAPRTSKAASRKVAVTQTPEDNTPAEKLNEELHGIGENRVQPPIIPAQQGIAAVDPALQPLIVPAQQQIFASGPALQSSAAENIGSEITEASGANSPGTSETYEYEIAFSPPAGIYSSSPSSVYDESQYAFSPQNNYGIPNEFGQLNMGDGAWWDNLSSSNNSQKSIEGHDNNLYASETLSDPPNVAAQGESDDNQDESDGTFHGLPDGGD